MDSQSPPHHWPPQGIGAVIVDQTSEKTTTTTKIRPQKGLNCRRCNSSNTKFCYYNNYSLSQPRYFCKTCRRYWTEGGTLRNVPVGGGSRKNKLRPNYSSSPKKLSPNYENPNPNLGVFVSPPALQNPNFSLLQPPHPSGGVSDHHPSLMCGGEMMMMKTMSLMGFSIDQNEYTARLMAAAGDHQDHNFNTNSSSSSPFDQEMKGSTGGSSNYIKAFGQGRGEEGDQEISNGGGGGGGGGYYWMNGMLGGGTPF